MNASFDSATTERLALALLHFLWQGVVIVAAVALFVRLFVVRTPQGRYASYLVALTMMAGCPPATFWYLTPASAGAIDRVAMQEAKPPVEPNPRPAMKIPVAPPPAAVPAVAINDAPAQVVVSGASWWRLSQAWIVAVWLVGVTLLSLRLLCGWILLQRLKRGAVPLPDSLNSQAARLAAALSMWLPRIRISTRVPEALAMGLLRPMILVPAVWITELPADMLEAVLAHELAHLRRLDLWVNLAQRIVETLLFYHPAIWWLSRRIREERELCCDELAVQVTGDRLRYVQTLEWVGRQVAGSDKPQFSLSIGGKRMNLFQRVRYIVSPKPAVRSRAWSAGLITLALAACAAWTFLSRPPIASAQAITDMAEQKAIFKMIAEKMLENRAKLHTWSGVYDVETTALAPDKTGKLVPTKRFGRDRTALLQVNAFHIDFDHGKFAIWKDEHKNPFGAPRKYSVQKEPLTLFWEEGQSTSPQALLGWVDRMTPEQFKLRVRIERKLVDGDELIVITQRYGEDAPRFDSNGLYNIATFSKVNFYHPIEEIRGRHSLQPTVADKFDRRTTVYRHVGDILLPEVLTYEYCGQPPGETHFRYSLRTVKINEPIPASVFERDPTSTERDNRWDDLLVVTGTVVDKAGHPVANAQVHSFSKDRWIDPPFRTDVAGHFNIPKTLWDEVDPILMAREGDRVGWYRNIDERAKADMDAKPKLTLLDFTQKGTAILTDAEGQPVAGAIVHVSQLIEKSNGELRLGDKGGHYASYSGPASIFESKTNQKGEFTIRLPEGAEATITPQSVEWLSFEVSGDAAANGVYQVKRAGRIVGQLLDTRTKQPIVKATMVASTGTEKAGYEAVYFAVTDEQGRFEFARLRPGLYSVALEPPEDHPELKGLPIEDLRVEADKIATINPTARVGRTVRGIVVDAETLKPVPGVLVMSTGSEPQKPTVIYPRTVSDSDGKFEFFVYPGPSHLYWQLPNRTQIGSNHREIEVPEDRDPDLIELKVKLTPGELERLNKIRYAPPPPPFLPSTVSMPEIISPAKKAVETAQVNKKERKDTTSQMVTGTVVDTNNNPVPNIDIEVFDAGKKIDPSLRSDVRGQFQIPKTWREQDRERKLLVVRKDDQLGWLSLADNGLPKQNAEKPFQLTMFPLNQTIRCTYTDEAGKPLADIPVQVYSLFDPTARQRFVSVSFGGMSLIPQGKTNQQGQISFKVPQGATVAVRPNHPDLLAVVGWFSAETGNEKAFQLGRGGSIAGRVVDAATGRPVSGALIGAQAYHTDLATGSWGDSITDEQGRYRINGLSPGQYNVLFISAGRKELVAPAVEGVLVQVGKVGEANLRAMEGRLVMGSAIDENGKPLVNAFIGYYGPARPNSGDACMSSYTDAMGNFSFYVLPGASRFYISDGIRDFSEDSERTIDVPVDHEPGIVLLKAGRLRKNGPTTMHPVSDEESKKVAENQDFRLNLRLQPPAGQTVKGVSYHSKNMEWYQSGSSATTTYGDGYAGSKITLRIDADGFAPAQTPEFIIAKKIDPITVDLKPAVYVPISGKVVDAKGKPVAGSRVRVGQADYGEFPRGVETMTDGDGKYTVKHLRVGDRFYLRVDKVGFADAETKPMLLEKADAVVMPDIVIGQVVKGPALEGTTGELKKPSKLLHITAFDAQDGKAIPEFRALEGSDGASVARQYEKRTGRTVIAWQAHTLRAAKAGEISFAMDNAWEETAVRVEADGYVPQAVYGIKKPNGTQELVFRLVRDKARAGRVLLPDGKPARGAIVALALALKDARLEDGHVRGADGPLPKDLVERWRRPLIVRTDADGRFQLPTETEPAALLVVHDAGAGELAYDAWEKAPEITLKRWGKVDGQLLWGNKSGAGQTVTLSFNRDEYGYPDMIAGYCADAQTDKDGRFHFDKVMPGLVQLNGLVKVVDPAGADGKSSNVDGMYRHVVVKPGDATKVVIGGRGRQVTGKLVGLDSWKGVTLHFHPMVPYVGIGQPGDEERIKSIVQLQSSDLGRILFRGNLPVKDDGSFVIEGMLPGWYQLPVTAPATADRDAYTAANVQVDVKPEASGETPAALDIGVVQVRKAEGDH